MKPSILLITAPLRLEARYGAFAGAASTEPSFALVCLGAVARRDGARVQLLDAAAEDLDPVATIDRIRAIQPDWLGISTTTAGIVQAARVAEAVRQALPTTRILVGGAHATALPERTLHEFPSFDLLVMGEGEQTLAELIAAWDATGTLPTDLPGTAVRAGDTVRVNPPRTFLEDLDTLPLPAWDLLHGFPRAYHPSPARIRRWPCASIVTTRGCPNRCTFCDRSVFGNRCRSYSPAYALRLVRQLHDDFGVRELLLEDDTFVIRRDHVEQFCTLLIESGMRVSWSCLGRADRMTPEILTLMRRAGCWHISYGIESGDPEILKAVNKNLDLPRIRQALEWTRAAGIRTKGFFMVGFPGETHESLQRTRDVALSLPLDDISVMQLTPFPGSDIFATAAVTGTFHCDWTRMTALESIYIPNGLTANDLERARRDLLRSFYLRPRILTGHLLDALASPTRMQYMARALGSLLRVALRPARAA